MDRSSPVPELLARDAHDARLLDNVRPGDWSNPEPAKRYDLVVVGAGTAGLVTTAIAAALGARVAIVERRLMGGDCLNFGCVPSKALIRAARGWAAAREAEARFGGPPASGEGDFQRAMERVRRLRAGISDHDSAGRFRDLGADVFLGDGFFESPDGIEVSGATLRFRRAVIATGARPSAPPIPGLRDAGYLTNETVFSLTAPPRRLAVIGGGAIGCELAQAFARLGVRVTLLEAYRLLPAEDPDAAAVVRRALEGDGVAVHTGARITGVARSGPERLVSWRAPDDSPAEPIVCDEILVATGRVPNVDGLGLDRAGVDTTEAGVVTDDRLRTTSRRIYAIGDVTGRSPFTHAADAHARLVVRNALFAGRGSVSDLIVPWCTYTSPEIAHVGITAAAAADAGDEVQTITIPLEEVDRARLDGEADGFLRIHLERGSDTILGATLVAERAGDIISQITLAMTAGLGLGRLGSVIFPYPTTAEIVRKAADAHARSRLTPTARRVLSAVLRVLR